MEIVGDVLRQPFGALKRICEENSQSSIIRMRLTNSFREILMEKMRVKNNKSLFDKNTVEKYTDLSKVMLEELKDDEELETQI